MSTNPIRSSRRAPGAVALVATTLVSLAILAGVAPVALAQTTNPGPAPTDPHPPKLTDTQRACLAQHGVQLPTPGSGQRPAEPSAQQRQAFEATATACGVTLPSGKKHPALTDAQRTCLTQHGVQLPTPGSGQRPARPTAEQRDAFAAAAKACGIPAPKEAPPAGI